MAFAGRISPEKDINFLVELHKLFRERGVWLALVGDGPQAEELAKMHGEKNKFYFKPGFLGHDDLAQLYASVDCCVSASTFETFGYTAIEAMACGTPFLGPRAQGYRDTVQHNKGGYLFDAKDITSAAHYLELMIEEKAELFPIERVLSNTDEFTAEACVKRTLAAYEVAKESRHTKSLFMSYVKAVLLFPPRVFLALCCVPIMFGFMLLMEMPVWYDQCCTYKKAVMVKLGLHREVKKSKFEKEVSERTGAPISKKAASTLVRAVHRSGN
mmetsp:Transcript_88126/g.251534  ORF Transcript_88126/g.251534 Transcript_88126/m.251534 type:complete len:271 (-) Transcript_88126:190-1002(-)